MPAEAERGRNSEKVRPCAAGFFSSLRKWIGWYAGGGNQVFFFFFPLLLLSRHQPSYSNAAHVSAEDNIKEGISRNGSGRNNPPGQATRVCHAGGGRGARRLLSAAATGAPLITRLMFCSRQTDRQTDARRDRRMLDGPKDTGGGGGGADIQVVALLSFLRKER